MEVVAWASQRGIALVVTMMVSLVIVGMAAAVVPLTTAETTVVFNHRRSLQMMYAAEAALEWGIRELSGVRSWDDVLTGRARSGFWGRPATVRLLDGGSVDLGNRAAPGWLGPRSRARGSRGWRLFAFGHLDQLVPGRISAPGLVVALWIADDPDDLDGNPLTDANQTIDVHAAAIGRTFTVRAIEASVRRHPNGRVSVRAWRVVR